MTNGSVAIFHDDHKKSRRDGRGINSIKNFTNFLMVRPQLLQTFNSYNYILPSSILLPHPMGLAFPSKFSAIFPNFGHSIFESNGFRIYVDSPVVLSSFRVRTEL